jgi:hypothetical protein
MVAGRLARVAVVRRCGEPAAAGEEGVEQGGEMGAPQSHIRRQNRALPGVARSIFAESAIFLVNVLHK